MTPRVKLLDARGHLLRGRDEQRGEADGVGVVLDRGVDDRVDRDLLAEVDDRVAVVGEDRVDERLADVVDVAEDGRDHDLALRVAFHALEVVLELGDRALHHLGRLEDERQDELAGAELVADLLHRRQQHLVQRRDRADLLDGLVDPVLDAVLLAAQDVPVERLLGLHVGGEVVCLSRARCFRRGRTACDPAKRQRNVHLAVDQDAAHMALICPGFDPGFANPDSENGFADFRRATCVTIISMTRPSSGARTTVASRSARRWRPWRARR